MSSSESIATPFAPDLAERTRVVGVEAHQRRHVERGREAGLAVLQQIAEAGVRLLGAAEAGELPHRPEPAAVHRGIDAARERIDAREAEVALVVDLDVVGRVERLVLEPGDRREELAVPLGLRLVELALPLGGRRRTARVDPRSWPCSCRLYGRDSDSCLPPSLPIIRSVEKFVAVVICALLTAPASGASNSPHAGGLLQRAARLSGLHVRHGVPTATLPAGRYDLLLRRAGNRDYPPALRSSDSVLYARLGLTQRSEQRDAHAHQDSIARLV